MAFPLRASERSNSEGEGVTIAGQQIPHSKTSLLVRYPCYRGPPCGETWSTKRNASGLEHAK